MNERANLAPETLPAGEQERGQRAPRRVLLASGNEEFRARMGEALRRSRFEVQEARGGAEALGSMGQNGGACLLLDRWLPDLEVTEVVEMARARSAEAEIWVVDSKSGDVILPLRPPAGHPILEEFQACWLPGRGEREAAEPGAAALEGMIGNSRPMAKMYRLARLVAGRDTPVLLTGETGTGKELVARAIHRLSARAHKPLVAVNCAAIPDSLLEAELFGYVRGAFTGAVQSRLGHIHAAHEGTLFLDEIGEIPLGMQAKLLRFLEEGEVQRLGSPDVFRVNVRVLAATNSDLARRVKDGCFRSDLYFRLAVFPIELPPLRDRAEDLPVLAAHFLDALCRQAGAAPKRFSAQALRLLETHSWPGNVRELQHAVERAFILAEQSQEIRPEHFFQTFRVSAA
jgi:DNA-binding NtrC family response regulator